MKFRGFWLECVIKGVAYLNDRGLGLSIPRTPDESTILSEMVCMAVFGDKNPKAPTDEERDKELIESYKARRTVAGATKRRAEAMIQEATEAKKGKASAPAVAAAAGMTAPPAPPLPYSHPAVSRPGSSTDTGLRFQLPSTWTPCTGLSGADEAYPAAREEGSVW